MEKPIALFDMDDTLADYRGQLQSDLSEMGSDKITNVFDAANLSPKVKRQMDEIRNKPGWWENLPPIESGIELMKLCAKIGFRIGILTQGPYKNRNGWAEKFNWCDKYVSPIDKDYVLIITRNGKGLVYGRVFVDDYSPYMSAWLKNRPRGLGIMPSREWNADFTHPQVIKYDPTKSNFDSNLVEKLKKAFSRKPYEDLTI